MKSIVHIFTLLLAVAAITPVGAQIILWEGAGDGTSWDDGANWSTGSVPTATDTAEIAVDATITGSLTEAPKRIKTGSGSTIKFQLDMNLDNVDGGDHALILGPKCTVEFGAEGTPYTFNFNTADNKHGLLANNSGDSSSIIIMADATLNFNQHNHAINVVAANTSVHNRGTINVSSAAKNGIQLGGQFTNSGQITITETNTDGIILLGGTFLNTEEGMITISKCGDDGIEITNMGSMTNEGMIMSTIKDDGSSANNAIAAGTAEEAGSFVNGFNGELVLEAGPSENARAVYVFEMGEFTNAGSINTSGGNAGSQIYSRNSFVNDTNGYILLSEGRINANMGTLVNNGFIESTREGSGIFTTAEATITNNAFFKYNNAGVFGIGEGTIIDNGSQLNNIYRWKIDAGGSCTVDIAEVAYDWTIGGDDYASSADDGTFTFLPNSVVADSVVLKTSLPEVNIKVVNICQEAVMSVSTDDELLDQEVKVYPTILTAGEVVAVELETLGEAVLMMYDMQGRIVHQQKVQGNTSLATDFLKGGQYVLEFVAESRRTTRMIVIH